MSGAIFMSYDLVDCILIVFELTKVGDWFGYFFLSDQYHISTWRSSLLLVGIVAKLNSNIVSYLRATNTGFFSPQSGSGQVKDSSATLVRLFAS